MKQNYPVKFCKYCNKQLHPKIWQGKTRKRAENKSRFLVRMYCGSICRSKQLSIDGAGKGNYFYGKHLMPHNKIDKEIIRHRCAKGYIEVRIRLEDGRQKTLYEHRYIMERELGRPLKSSEIIHHIDHNRQNNKPNNLLVFPTSAEHLMFHRIIKKISQTYAIK